MSRIPLPLLLLLALLIVAPVGCAPLGPPDRSSLSLLPAQVEIELRLDHWHEVRAGDLRIYSNTPAEELEGLLDSLFQLRSLLDRVTELRRIDVQRTTHIVIFDSGLDYRHIVGEDDPLAFYLPSQRFPMVVTTAGRNRRYEYDNYVYWSDRVDVETVRSILRHEYVHLVLDTHGLVYPAWYHEGMAQMFENLKVREGYLEVGHPPIGGYDPLGIAMASLLKAANYHGWNVQQRASFYRHAWGVTHMLHHGHTVGFPNRRAALQRYLEGLDQGVSVGAASREAFGVGPARLGTELKRYLRSDAFSYYKYPRRPFGSGPLRSVESSPAARHCRSSPSC